MMAWTDCELPFAESPSPIAAQASFAGAQDAAHRSQTQTLRLLELYAKRGPTTDWDAAKMLDIERSTVNARRVPLCRRGIVVAVDKVMNDATGSENTRWGLSRRGNE